MSEAYFPKPSGRRVSLGGPTLRACSAVAEQALAPSRQQVAALRAAQEALTRRLSAPDWLRTAADGVWILVILAQVVATQAVVAGRSLSAVSDATAALSRIGLFRFRPFAWIDAAWESWLAGQFLPALFDSPALWWVAPDVMRFLAVVAGVLWVLRAFAVRLWNLQSKRLGLDASVPSRVALVGNLSGIVLTIAWTVLSVQFFALGTVLTLCLGVVIMLVWVPEARWGERHG